MEGYVFQFFFLSSSFWNCFGSWLSGFLAFRLLGFLAFGFSVSWLFGFLLVYAAFGGFLALAFRILYIPSSSSAGGVLAFAAFRWFMRLLGILCFPTSSPGIFAVAPFH